MSSRTEFGETLARFSEGLCVEVQTNQASIGVGASQDRACVTRPAQGAIDNDGARLKIEESEGFGE